MAAYTQILYEVDDPVATITLNRPEALNAWTDVMGTEVRHAVAQAEADPRVVGIVLTGAGRGFCAGADMNTLTDLSGGGANRADAEAVPMTSSTTTSALQADPGDPEAGDDLRGGTMTYLMAVPKPVIAAINGAVAGMAVPLVLACDLRFMAEDAPLLTAFSQRGLIGEWGITWLLPRLVGTGVALDLLFSSRRVTGAEAESLGLVNAALPRDEVLSHAHDYVRRIAATSSPASMAVMKRQVYQQLHTGYLQTEHEARRLMLESFRRPDFAEGVSSFLEKRPPAFRRLGESG